MVDFHTHILPGMDDGSKSLRQSLIMLRMEREMGIDTIVLTPHFYARENDPARFLERRERAWERLSGHLGPRCPRLLLGAEVLYFDNMDNAEHIASLCIGSTGVLLLEMPFCPGKDTWAQLRESGILMQVNCSFFSGWLRRKRAMAMMERGEFHLIGSDCHNLDTRAPNWPLVPAPALRLAEKTATTLLGLPPIP